MRRWSSILLWIIVFGACDRPGSGEVVRSAPREVSPPPSSAPETGTPAGSTAGAAILFLGTSLTEGYGLSDPQDAYPALVGEQIRAAGLPFRVVNGGVAGETSAGGLARLDWVLRARPRVLVIELGANDGLRGLPVDALETNLRQVIRHAREQLPDIQVVLLAMEAPPNLGPAYTVAFREVYTGLADSEDVTLVPFFLDGIAGVRPLNQADGIHPTSEGHALMADRVWSTLEPLLRTMAPEGE